MKSIEQKSSKKQGKAKKTRQGKSRNTKLSKRPSNNPKKKYRGQG